MWTVPEVEPTAKRFPCTKYHSYHKPYLYVSLKSIRNFKNKPISAQLGDFYGSLVTPSLITIEANQIIHHWTDLE
jgi:hypothetical protein